MDDIKIILWVVIGLIYLFSRRKKPQQPPTPQRNEAPEQEYSEPAPKPVSFEDLLREIQEMKKPEPKPVPEPTYYDVPPKQEYEEEEVVEEEKSLEKAYDYRQEKTYETYEEAKKQAFARPSLEETAKLEDTIVRFSQFKSYQKEVKANPLA
ncbi:MAG: hypothetical protein K2U26_14245, partial [Cyclobacteriaceae bacterium]|nr:hypothetical protein [Cyclobacteriaceae bacterium]